MNVIHSVSFSLHIEKRKEKQREKYENKVKKHSNRQKYPVIRRNSFYLAVAIFSMYPFLRSLYEEEVVKRDDEDDDGPASKPRVVATVAEYKKKKKGCIIKKVGGEGESSYNKLFPGPISQTCYHHRLFLIPPPPSFRYSRHPIQMADASDEVAVADVLYSNPIRFFTSFGENFPSPFQRQFPILHRISVYRNFPPCPPTKRIPFPSNCQAFFDLPGRF